MGHLPQLDEDFRLAVRQSFASSEIERHAPPPPIVDVSLQGDEGLSARRAAELIDVARDPSAAYYAGAILTNDGVGCCRSLVDRAKRPEHFTFSSRTSVALKWAGGSIATSAKSCSMWFCTISRRAPALS